MTARRRDDRPAPREPGAAAAVWAALNERQRAYLREAFALDQETEAAVAGRRGRGFFGESPASVWRWLRYGYVHALDDPSGLALRLMRQGYADAGTGSTWRALARRGLLLTRYVLHPVVPREWLLEVRLTPLGRRVVRGALPGLAPARRPRGALTEWQWRVLGRIRAQGAAGIPFNPSLGGYPGVGETTLRRLKAGRDGALVEEADPATGATRAWVEAGDGYVLRLTERGQGYADEHRARYRALYPDVEAPAPGALP